MMSSHDSLHHRNGTHAAARPASGAVDEPLAIVGIGCRLPGGCDDWQSFWRLLEEGRDAVGEVPEERWSDAKFYQAGRARPGKIQSRWGGFVAGLDEFDPQCFGISPREAAGMDPQQRMLLEVAYRAVEDAGLPNRALAGRSVAVYVGISSFDHAVATLSLRDRGAIDAYSNTGGSSSIAANRISYCLDLRGPSVAVDTACSSSLVAVHLACEAVRRGEAKMALAGGVNAILMPDFSVAFSQLGVLSPDGRCKTFDARANGYVRSEGAGMVLIKPLADAVRDGDLVYAVIRSTVLNQDGRTPGLTVPSGEAQQALVRDACRRAGVDPAAVQYVEAHGTGTPVGDPIEANALGAALGAGRPADRPCWIGSVKTNIGHLEAAAGIASLIKVTLALHHRRIPAHLHLREPNPAIDFGALRLRVPTTAIDWPGDAPRLAGINGFGYGGANAHVLLEEAPATPPPPAVAPPRRVLVPLAARSRRSLAGLAARLADWAADAEADLPEIAAFLAHRHAGEEARAAVVAADRGELVAKLRDLAGAIRSESGGHRDAPLASAAVAFVFSGQGPQWWGMARRLLAENDVFRGVIERCDAEFARHGDWSLVEELGRDEATSRMKQTRIAQPAIFAVQAGLAAVWRSWGIEPARCVGHSVGEIAAAHAAGSLSFEDACLVAFHRGRTMDLASSQGGMIAVGLSREEVAPWLADCEGEVSIAAVNGPTSLTLSGSASIIAGLATRLEEAGVFCRRLAVEYAFHSPLMDPVRGALLESLAGIRPRATKLPLVSTVTGQVIDGRSLDGEYWWRNVRQAVLFADAMRSLASAGTRVAVEIGPHPVLAYAINECFQAAGRPVETLPSLHRDRDDLERMLESLGRLHARGLDIDWARLHDRPRRRLPLPLEPFQAQRLRSESLEARESRYATDWHPLLGERADGPVPRWQCRVDLRLQSYLRDHVVRGACLHPAAAVVEAAIAAGRQLAGPEAATVRLQRLQFHAACIHSEEAPRWMECQARPDRRTLAFAHRDVDDVDWRPLATIGLATDTGADRWPAELLAAGRKRCTERFDRERLYAHCGRLGLTYGEQFQGLAGGVRRVGECVGEVELPAELAAELDGHFVHPALLDACFHAMIAADRDFDHTVSGLYLPHEMREIRFLARPGSRATVHARITARTDDAMEADLDIYDADGRPCLAIRGFVSHRVAGTEPADATAEMIYRLDWEPQELPPAEAPAAPGRWLVFADDGGCGDRLAARLAAAGGVATIVRRGDRFAARTDGSFVVNVDDREDFERLFAAVRDGGIAGIAYLWALDAAPVAVVTAAGLEADALLTCRGPLHLVQAWEEAGPATAAACVFVTSAAQPPAVGAEPLNVSQAPLVGMGRVVASEYGRLRTRLVDLAGDPLTCLGPLVAEMLAGSPEDEVLLRSAGRWVRRFRPLRELDACPAAAAALPARLEAADTAGIDDLGYRLFQPPVLAPGEVEIEVHAAGLNFSDVMKALDLYPGLPPGPVALGSECSGVVTRVGLGVTEWRPGDEVMAVAPGAFGTHAVAVADLVARKPRNLSHAQAAALPIAFLTAAHALHECGRIRAGESVLVHAASGGVGLAALQLARLAGARILATAGSDEKREFVRRRGAEHVMDSRSLGFADETRRLLPDGVDLVLNSLPGEAITRGIAALATGGRFLEIGKRDIYADAALGLHAFRNNIAFFAIDLDQLFKQQPAKMGRALRALVPRFESGELEPLPVTVHAAADAAAAFRSMQQARHVGKVVIDYAPRPARVRPPSRGSVTFDPQGTYWVAGGLGGFGLEIARWLGRQGAGTIVLGGRSATVSPAAAAAIAEIERGGTDVHLLPADIARPEEVRRVLDRIARTMPPLKGIFHTAMVLEDRLLLDLDHATLDRVLRPKLLGGWNLHRESAGLDLDQFVLFSSLSSVFGHAGQANYAAANAALDTLAHHRRAMGLPATVVNWGHLGEVGYLAQRDELSARLERQGVLSFTVRDATDCLAAAIVSREPQLSVLRMDWTLWRGLGITDNVPPKFAHLLRSADGDGGTGGTLETTPESLRAAPAGERPALVQRMVRAKTARLLGLATTELDGERPLLELGLDSLMAVELRNWIENQTGVPLPISGLLRGGSVDSLAATIAAGLDVDGDRSAEVPRAEPAPTTAETEFPLSAGQQGLWYAYRRDPAATPYNVFLPVRVRSPLDVEALRKTIEAVVARHPALRTTFSDQGGRLVQRVQPALPPEFVVQDAAGSGLEEVRQRMLTEVARPFDLEHGPLLRMAVYRLADDDWAVLATTHHIAVDFWSLILMLDEVGRAYPRLAIGAEPDLPPAPANYAEFVRRQEALRADERGETLRRYWREQLADLPTVLELPTDRVRPRSFTGRAETVSLEVPDLLVGEVARLAAAARVTPSAVVLAALQVLLSRYTGRTSFVIGTPFSGRSERRFEDTVGFFANMLPLPARLEDAPTFAELVGRVGAALVGGLEHEDYPLASIVGDLEPDRDPSRSPLIQVTCTFEKSHRAGEQGRAGFLFPDRSEAMLLGGLRQESFHVPQRTCLFDAEFVFEITQDSLSGMICYCRDLFAADSMHRLARNFTTLFEQLLRSPGEPVDRVAWPAEQLPASGPAPAVGAAESLGGLVRPVIDAAPQRAVIIDGNRTWTYGAVAAACGRIATELAAAGVGKGDFVPVVGHGAEALVGTLGTILAGAAAVPIDSRQPAVSAPDLEGDTGARVAVVAGGGAWIDAAGMRRIDVAAADSTSPAAAFRADVGPKDLAYCVFTSGSTGRPKGVLVEHAAVANMLAWRRAAVPLTADDRVLVLFSHQFDAALGIVFTTLTQGATLVMADAEARADVSRLIDQIVRDRITVIPGVPALLQLVAAHPRYVECTSLREVWTGGEQMPAELAALLARLPGVTVRNFYGPTEAAIEAAACVVDPGDPTRRVPIGTPVAGTQLLVLDALRRPVPDTVPGELAIAGAGLARGYLERPDLTAERFVRLDAEFGGLRVYLTGDRCRRRPDGGFEFLGRLDDQVKLRGYRLELGEVESCLRGHPAVAGVAAQVLDGDSPLARLVGFVVSDRAVRNGTAAALATDIREFAAERLPAYKVPSAIVFLDALPLTAGGKIDRSRLPRVAGAEARAEEFVPPATPLEQYLAEAWQQALGIERVGLGQNFFDLGGTSLQAAVLTATLGEQLGVHVPATLLFDLADVGQIARRLVQLHPVEIEARFGRTALDAHERHGAPVPGGAAVHDLLVPLKPEGHLTPLFMIHPPGGIVICYRDLARCIEPARPLYGVRSRGTHGSERLPETLGEMAAEYVAAIRSRQPAGPYLLGGWSLGGVIAAEVARQLVAAGEAVESLFLLDSAIPEPSLPAAPGAKPVHAGMEYGLDVDLQELARMSPEEQLPFLWDHARRLGILDTTAPEELVTRVLADLRALFAHHVALCEQHRLRPCPIDAVLFRPLEVPFDTGGPADRGWGRLLRSVEVRQVPGHHHSMVTPPHVEALAAAIGEALAEPAVGG